MVTRKPLPQDGGLRPASPPPYPITPIDTTPLPQFRMQDAHNALRSPESESESPNASSQEGRHGRQAGQNEIPDLLRAGPPEYSQRGSQDILRPNTTTTNPYLQRQSRNDNKDSSAAAWGGFAERPSPPSQPPPPPPISKGLPPKLSDSETC
jgi:hypothetical protein